MYESQLNVMWRSFIQVAKMADISSGFLNAGHMLPLSPSCFGNLDTPNLINLPLPDVELSSHEEFAELQLHTGHTPQQPGLLQVRERMTFSVLAKQSANALADRSTICPPTHSAESMIHLHQQQAAAALWLAKLLPVIVLPAPSGMLIAYLFATQTCAHGHMCSSDIAEETALS